MSTKSFAEASTGFFNLTLSKAQCNALLRTDTYSTFGDGAKFHALNMHSMAIIRELEGRGLVSWKADVIGKFDGFQGLTPAGKTVVALLYLAGLTVENTNTNSVLNRLARIEHLETHRA